MITSYATFCVFINKTHPLNYIKLFKINNNNNNNNKNQNYINKI